MLFLPVRKFASCGNHTIIFFCEIKDSPVLQIIGQDERPGNSVQGGYTDYR